MLYSSMTIMRQCARAGNTCVVFTDGGVVVTHNEGIRQSASAGASGEDTATTSRRRIVCPNT